MNKASLAQVKEIVGKIPLPDFVHDIEYELDEDHLGNPCVRIQVIVSDDSGLTDVPKYLELKSAISRAVLDTENENWPYVSFIGESKHEPMAGAL